MTLTIRDESISSDNTSHTARLASGQNYAWYVSWLPGRLMDRNSAITAMVLADVVVMDDVHPGHQLWPHIEGWAVELGLTAPDALAWTGRASGEKEAAAPEDPEAAGA